MSKFLSVLCLAAASVVLAGGADTSHAEWQADSQYVSGFSTHSTLSEWHHTYLVRLDKYERAQTSGSRVQAAPRCTIDRIPISLITKQDFDEFFLEKQPVILEGTDQAKLAYHTRKDVLLNAHGGTVVKVSAADSYSQGKAQVMMRDYIASFSNAPRSSDTPRARANESFYLFGPHAELSPVLRGLVSLYNPPPCSGDDLAFSFGIGAHASGVPFHVHGHGFSEVIHGEKRWLLYPPEHRPRWNPDASPADWLQTVYPTLTGADWKLLEECDIQAGEVLYFPSGWWHAVVNVGETVFVSSFERNTGTQGHQNSLGGLVQS